MPKIWRQGRGGWFKSGKGGNAEREKEERDRKGRFSMFQTREE